MTDDFSTELGHPFTDAVDKVRTALAAEGFGILTEIDITATMQAKLGVGMEDYLILGACNPSLAHRALEIDRRVGQLMPCNVVVRDIGGGVLVEAMDPQLMVQFTGRPELGEVADEAAAKLRAAMAALKA
ncbi:DUF302 domain-containing protein [Kitasatospora griseola]|uniref:DUF302 domain-containing protein n=1 Tax=Kitasatospora griseola TaxID=2064 RepID=UPI003800AB15